MQMREQLLAKNKRNGRRRPVDAKNEGRCDMINNLFASAFGNQVMEENGLGEIPTQQINPRSKKCQEEKKAQAEKIQEEMKIEEVNCKNDQKLRS